jgi:hypothetical protein
VRGKQPEVWLPDTGRFQSQLVFDQTTDGRTTVPLRLEPYGSRFVVFRSPAGQRIVSVTKDGVSISPAKVEIRSAPGSACALRSQEAGEYELRDAQGRSAAVRIPPLPAPRDIGERWTLHAPPKELFSSATRPVVFDTLKSWTDCDDPDVKYFSGTLDYTKEIEVAEDLLGPGKTLILDLGEVRELAEVRLQGRSLGILWKPPFQVDITSSVKPGRNILTVRVTNFWPNRIIGDQSLPEDRRFTRTNIAKLKKDTPLMPSGLLGPVRLFVVGEQVAMF